jgi:hypothetical protein
MIGDRCWQTKRGWSPMGRLLSDWRPGRAVRACGLAHAGRNPPVLDRGSRVAELTGILSRGREDQIADWPDSVRDSPASFLSAAEREDLHRQISGELSWVQLF